MYKTMDKDIILSAGKTKENTKCREIIFPLHYAISRKKVMS